MTVKHNIPKSKNHINCRLLPNYIVCEITQRNNIRRENTCDPALKLLNEEITSDIKIIIKKPIEGTLSCTLGSQAQHAHSLEAHTRSIQQSTSTHTTHFQQQNNNNNIQDQSHYVQRGKRMGGGCTLINGQRRIDQTYTDYG